MLLALLQGIIIYILIVLIITHLKPFLIERFSESDYSFVNHLKDGIEDDLRNDKVKGSNYHVDEVKTSTPGLFRTESKLPKNNDIDYVKTIQKWEKDKSLFGSIDIDVRLRGASKNKDGIPDLGTYDCKNEPLHTDNKTVEIPLKKIKDFKNTSLTHCGEQCKDMDVCAGFRYNKNTKHCILTEGTKIKKGYGKDSEYDISKCENKIPVYNQQNELNDTWKKEKYIYYPKIEQKKVKSINEGNCIDIPESQETKFFKENCKNKPCYKIPENILNQCIHQQEVKKSGKKTIANMKECDKGYKPNSKRYPDKCVPCSVGEYGNSKTYMRFDWKSGVDGKESCIPCNYDEYQDNTGQYKCKSCPDGHYTRTKGQSECIPCDNKSIRLKKLNEPIPEDAKSCSGHICKIDGQACPPGVPHSTPKGSSKGYICRNKKWDKDDMVSIRIEQNAKFTNDTKSNVKVPNDAKTCTGEICDIEKQICSYGRSGAWHINKDEGYICRDKNWVRGNLKKLRDEQKHEGCIPCPINTFADKTRTKCKVLSKIHPKKGQIYILSSNNKNVGLHHLARRNFDFSNNNSDYIYKPNGTKLKTFNYGIPFNVYNYGCGVETSDDVIRYDSDCKVRRDSVTSNDCIDTKAPWYQPESTDKCDFGVYKKNGMIPAERLFFSVSLTDIKKNLQFDGEYIYENDECIKYYNRINEIVRDKNGNYKKYYLMGVAHYKIAYQNCIFKKQKMVGSNKYLWVDFNNPDTKGLYCYYSKIFSCNEKDNNYIFNPKYNMKQRWEDCENGPGQRFIRSKKNVLNTEGKWVAYGNTFGPDEYKNNITYKDLLKLTNNDAKKFYLSGVRMKNSQLYYATWMPNTYQVFKNNVYNKDLEFDIVYMKINFEMKGIISNNKKKYNKNGYLYLIKGTPLIENKYAMVKYSGNNKNKYYKAKIGEYNTTTKKHKIFWADGNPKFSWEPKNAIKKLPTKTYYLNDSDPRYLKWVDNKVQAKIFSVYF